MGRLAARIWCVPGSFRTTLDWHQKRSVTLFILNCNVADLNFSRKFEEWCWIFRLFVKILTFTPRFVYNTYSYHYDDKHHDSNSTVHVWPESVLNCRCCNWGICKMREEIWLGIKEALAYGNRLFVKKKKKEILIFMSYNACETATWRFLTLFRSHNCGEFNVVWKTFRFFLFSTKKKSVISLIWLYD